ncbi:unnamed protein product [Ectocarpus sp. CCAP 1310/34]|nr:unnamed protein product [Ectocarpus sp. CCAP 1310/34]
MCPFTLGRSFTGKEGFPTIAYEVTVDHVGRALAVTNGFTGATNDKTIIRYDSGVNNIRTESQYTEREYKLRKVNGTERTRRGCFLIMDNWYHEWVTLIAPSKYPQSNKDTAFSRHLESVRKDVECFFGILKGRFRILKLRMPYHKREYIDNIFFTCCILHNMLHTFDGLDVFDENTDWTGSAGHHDAWEHDPLTDYTSVGSKGVLLLPKEGEEEECGEGGHVRKERHPDHAELKRQLIESFAFRKKINDITWLSRPK